MRVNPHNYIIWVNRSCFAIQYSSWFIRSWMTRLEVEVLELVWLAAWNLIKYSLRFIMINIEPKRLIILNIISKIFAVPLTNILLEGLCLVVPDKHTIKDTNVFLAKFYPSFYLNNIFLAQKLTKLQHLKETMKISLQNLPKYGKK